MNKVPEKKNPKIFCLSQSNKPGNNAMAQACCCFSHCFKKFCLCFFKLGFVGTFLRNKLDQSYQILILGNYELQYPNRRSLRFKTTLIWSEQWISLNVAATNNLNFGSHCQVIFWWLGSAGEQRGGEYGEQVFHWAKFRIQVKTATRKGRKSDTKWLTADAAATKAKL